MPIPTEKVSRGVYLEVRDYRNRWRQEQDKKGFLTPYCLEQILDDSELAHFNESVDFAKAEGMLDAEQIDAAQNVIAWANVLKDLIKKEML